MQIALMPFENRMLGHLQHHVQIARRTAVGSGLAFLAQAKLRAVVDSRRDVYFQLAFATQISFAAAFFTGTANNLPSPIALRQVRRTERNAC